jgi:hypothetical protein
MTDDPLHPIRNVALLIDADNASPDTLDPVLTVLAELGTVNIRRAYGNWEKPGLKGWAKIVHLHAIEPHQQFDVTKGKSATDMKMVIDAMDLIYGGRVGGFGIMSSDSDFMPLAMRIRQDGLPVYGFGTAKTPLSFQNACSRFIEVGALKAANIASASDAGGTEARPVDEDLIKILGDAWKSSKRDEYGFASLREVGKLAGNRSSFDARSYGYASLSDLIQAIPNFQVDRGKDGETIVRRVR